MMAAAAALLALAVLGAMTSGARAGLAAEPATAGPAAEPAAARTAEPAIAGPAAEPATAGPAAEPATAGPAVEPAAARPAAETAGAEPGCPRGCVCYPGVEARLEYECALGGGTLQVTVSARDGWLTARCEHSPRLPAAADLPLLPAAPAGTQLRDVKLTDCRVSEGGWAGVLRALGVEPAAVRSLALDDLHEGNQTEEGAAALADQLSGLPALELLKLGGWRGARLPALGVALPVLRDLRVSGAGGPALELEAGTLALPLLERLELTGAGLARLPAAALRPLARLRRLFLWRNRLTALEPALLAGARALESVDLSDNVGLRVPARLLAELPALREVSLRGCRLTALPPDTFEGSRALRTLLLANNNLTALPGALLRDQLDLRKLDLSGNKLAVLTGDLFSTLTRLEHLNLDRNNITSLPGGVFSGLRGVQTVSLAHNRLHTIGPTSFAAHPALTRLVLAYNNLSALCESPPPIQGDYWSVTKSPFEPLKNSLQHLDLSHNRIQNLCDDWQHLLLKLTYLDLSYNEFTELTDADFNFLSNTVVVDWRHNRITTARLSESHERAASGAEQSAAGVLLDHNPLHCDCRLYELARRLHAPAAAAASVRDQPACAAPPALSRRALRDVPLDMYSCALPAAACPGNCTCALVPHARELRLTCAAVPVPATWPALPAGTDGSSLRLTRAPPAGVPLSLPAHVRTLNVSRLGLTAVPRVPPLRLLDLRGNELRVAAPPDNTTRLLLAGNELACDCDHAANVAALQRNKDQVVDWEQLQCGASAAGGGGGARLRLAGTAAAALCPALPAWLAALAGLAALLAALAVLACWRWERELRIVLGCCWRRPADDEEREYDVFVAFAHQDEEWVARELVPRLEGGARPLRVCLHYRDWQVGEFITRQIHRSVAQSRRTLVVLSDDFLRSAWASAEFRAAYVAETQERRARVAVVVLRPPTPALLDQLPELKAYLKTTTYVQVGSPFFWSILRKALPPGRAPAAPAPPDDKPGAGAGALDVRLTCDGLVNVALCKDTPTPA